MPDKRSAEATARIITVLQVLADHLQHGIDVTTLLRNVGSYGGKPESHKDALIRDLRHLRSVGFEVENIAGDGEDARYRLRPGDDRVRLAFSKEQLFQLRRAAVLVGVDRLASGVDAAMPDTEAGPRAANSGPVIEPIMVPDVLGWIRHAVSSSATARFDYSGRTRTVHPYGLRIAERGWILDGWEQESRTPKVFSLQKMGSVQIGLPGSASPPERSSRPTLDPLRFEVDDAAQAVLQVTKRFRPQVDAVLRPPIDVAPGPVIDGEESEILHYRVTNHVNFLVRVLRLDERVLLRGDSTMRAALGRMLRGLAEVS